MVLNVIFLISLLFFVYIIPPGGFSAWSFKSGVRWLYLFIVSFLIFNIFYPFLIKIAWKINAIDFPDKRKVHLKPTPRIGGVGLYVAFVFTVIRNFQFPKEIIGILIGSTIIFIIGFLDDIKGMSAKSRLMFQFIAASIVVFMGVRINYPLHYGFYREFFSYISSVLWIVGITNAFNFMDGIDGMCASMGLVISIVFLILTAGTLQYDVMFITASLCGAMASFLIYNFHPAKIFLGDSGSTLIGFVLSCLGIYTSWANDNPFISFSLPVIVLSIPIFDLIYTTISRFRNGVVKNLTQLLEYTGKDHFHHRLIAIGFSIKSAVVLVSLLNLLLGLIAVRIIVNDYSLEVILSFLEVVLIFIIIVLIMITARNKIVEKQLF